jgi:hypothetical protein
MGRPLPDLRNGLVADVFAAPDDQHRPVDPGQLLISQHITLGLCIDAREHLAQVGRDGRSERATLGAQVGGAN